VVSVRLDRHLVDVLDRLVEHTGRSRSFYLREALRAQLPALVEQYWAHEVKHQRSDEDTAFAALMQQLLTDE